MRVKHFSLLGILLTLAASVSVFATDVTISTAAIAPWTGPTSNVELRLFLSEQLVTPENQRYAKSSPSVGTTTFKWDCTVASGVLTIPQIVLPATTNVVGGGRVRWTAVFWNKVTNLAIQSYVGYEYFQVPVSPSPTAWDAIKTYNTDVGAQVLLKKNATLYDIEQGIGGVEAKKANRAGDTFTGPITLPGNPTTSLQAAPKQYVDSKLNPTATKIPLRGASGLDDSSLTESSTKLSISKPLELHAATVAQIAALPDETIVRATDGNRGLQIVRNGQLVALNGGVFDVREFGASPIASGAANATAFAAVSAAVTDGAVIDIPAGNYAATTTTLFNLAGKNNITIRGAGHGVTTITFTGTGTTPSVFYLANGTKITVKGLSIAGSYHRGVFGSASHGLTVEDCDIQGATNAANGPAGVYCDTCDDVTIRNNSFSNNGNGSTVGGAAGGDIYLYRSIGGAGASQKRTKIIGNTAISTAVTYHIGTFDLEDYVISLNQLKGAAAGNVDVGGYGIMVYRTNSGSSWLGNPKKGVIANNTIEFVAGIGIYAQGGIEKSITGNIIKSPCGVQQSSTLHCGGIVVEGGPADINGGLIADSGEDGLHIQGIPVATTGGACPNDATCDAGFTVSNLTILRTSKQALVATNAHNTKISNSKFISAGRFSSISGSENVSIANSTWDANGIEGAGGFQSINVTASPNLKMDNVEILNSSGSALYLTANSGFKFTRSKIRNVTPATSFAIRLDNNTGAEVSDSEFETTSGAEAIWENGGSSANNRFLRNKISGFTTKYLLTNAKYETLSDLVTTSATASGTTTLDLSQGANRQVTFGAGNTVFALSNIPAGEIAITLIQDATGSRAATWPASIKWEGGTAPTLSTAANAVDVFVFVCNGTVCREKSRALNVN
jgi:Right handed beta helix region